MKVLVDLMDSDVGIMSALTILGVIVIAGYMFFWVKSKIREDSRSH